MVMEQGPGLKSFGEQPVGDGSKLTPDGALSVILTNSPAPELYCTESTVVTELTLPLTTSPLKLERKSEYEIGGATFKAKVVVRHKSPLVPAMVMV